MKARVTEPALGAPIPIVGGNVGDTIQKLFMSNSVEELIVYKASLQSQAAAVDDDVRAAIGLRYRDLLATCAEVVGMESVCQNVERARQKRQQQIQQAGGGRRFANALKAANQQALPMSPQQGGNSATLANLSLIMQGLQARLGSLQVLLCQCKAPRGLLDYAAKLDSHVATTAQQTRDGRALSASPNAPNPPSALSVAALGALYPPPTFESGHASQLLFNQVATEHSRLLTLCTTFGVMLKKFGTAFTEDTERRTVALISHSLEAQLLSTLSVKVARSTSAGGRGAADIRGILDNHIIRAIGGIYQQANSTDNRNSTGAATKAALMLIYNDIHQALTIEELLADRIVGQPPNPSPPAHRALTRLIGLQEASLRLQLSTRSDASNILGAASLCVNGVNGLLTYVNTLLASLVKQPVPQLVATMQLTDRLVTANPLLALTSGTTKTTAPSASKGSPLSAKETSVGAFSAKADRDALLDHLLVHACGTVDVRINAIPECNGGGAGELGARLDHLAAAVFSPPATLTTRSNECLLLNSLGDAQSLSYLQWVVDVEDGPSAGPNCATPSRGTGAWATSPSPTLTLKDTSQHNAVSYTPDPSWEASIVSAFTSEGANPAAVKAVLQGRFDELQQSLSVTLFGDGKDSSLLAALVATPNDPIQSAKALQTLEALLLGVGAGNATEQRQGASVWDTSRWANVVKSYLGGFVETSIAVLVKGVATSALGLGEKPGFSIRKVKETRLHSSEHFYAVGMLEGPSPSAQGAETAAAVEERIASLIRTRTAKRTTAAKTETKIATKNHATASHVYQHLNAVAIALSRDDSSTALKDSVKRALNQELLETIERQLEGHATMVTPSTSIPALAPAIGALISSLDLISAKVSERDAPNPDAVQFLVTVLRPRLSVLFSKCFSSWITSVTNQFKRFLLSGWRTSLLANSTVDMRLDFDRLRQLVSVASSINAKAKVSGKQLSAKSAKIVELVKHSDQFTHTARDLSSAAAKRFRNSVQPLLWATEVLASSEGPNSSVACPKRCHPLVLEAVWWVQQTIGHDLKLLYSGAKEEESTSKDHIVTLSSNLLAPHIFGSLQQAALEVFTALKNEGIAAGRRAVEAEAILKGIFAEAAKAPPTPQVPEKGTPAAADNGWGKDDDDDFELDYGDEEKPKEASQSAAEPTLPAVGATDDLADDEGLDAFDDVVYNEYAPGHGAEAYGICEEYYLQLLMDFIVLGKVLGTASAWESQCKAKQSEVQDEVDIVTWNLALPFIKAAAEDNYRQGQLLWGLGLSAATLGSKGLSQTPAPTSGLATAPKVPTLLAIPATEVERLPLLPVALPQAAHTVLPATPMAPTSPYMSTGGAAQTGLPRDTGASSKLVQGATASLKSFLGGW